ncbi:HalOD1 output domain-containing protein [Halorarius halobius]|uniref:HalOD1 output domain-containing protein n=1 Tax=Halorarius halobius TaxID=2962671 RepID=UPI0020CCFF01|nr:HalOD1 output domain-containing protein [Halorarius halobius]
MGGEDDVTFQIVSELEAAGVDVEQLPPLMEYVDTEALETLVAHAREHPDAAVTVRFDYAGITVTIAGGEVEVVEREPSTKP